MIYSSSTASMLPSPAPASPPDAAPEGSGVTVVPPSPLLSPEVSGVEVSGVEDVPGVEDVSGVEVSGV